MAHGILTELDLGTKRAQIEFKMAIGKAVARLGEGYPARKHTGRNDPVMADWLNFRFVFDAVCGNKTGTPPQPGDEIILKWVSDFAAEIFWNARDEAMRLPGCPPKAADIYKVCYVPNVDYRKVIVSIANALLKARTNHEF